MKGIIIAGTNSGCGKTTVTLGLMSLLQECGLQVAPFKTGPDFIDPAFHSKVTGTSSHNLDTFLLSNDVVKHLYAKYSEKKDIAVVEGVMGLFDGMGEKATGSAAELSKLLGLPVILVVNCSGMYQSVSAIISGFKNYDSELNVAGVILNKVPNDDAYNFLKKMIETHTGVKCVGYLPNNKNISLESRHLGLVQAEEVKELDEKIKQLTLIMKQSIDVNALVAISEQADMHVPSNQLTKIWYRNLKNIRIAVARDKAFQFYYQANLQLLTEGGAELVFFSPLKDRSLPLNVKAIYLGGGYPEIFANELSNNKTMLADIKKAAVKGLPIFAECGGMMYLTEGINDADNNFHPMVGVFNCRVEMTQKLQHFGYCNVNFDGSTTRAHEFHRSQIVKAESTVPNYELSYELNKPERDINWTCGLKYKNTLAGYAHFHFWSQPVFYNKIIDLWMQKII